LKPCDATGCTYNARFRSGESKYIMAKSAKAPVVGIIMGSQSDWETMRHAASTLDELGVPYETRIVSAHRTPRRMVSYAESARERGLKAIVAGAGGAAHLPGMTASLTTLPVFGVPVESQALKGMDSLLSIVQMPAGIPVGTLAIGKAGAINAALLAASVVALSDATVLRTLERWRKARSDAVAEQPDDGAPTLKKKK
jgi:5-(carboxyamino)imidazole ribonucleotide mutase